MKKALVVCLFTIVSSYACGQTWVVVYQNDAEGNKVSGSLNELREAVRAGLPIRVGWKGQSASNPKIKVEHVTDAKFLTIMSDEVVFAQIDPIIGQTPDFDRQFIELKGNTSWVMIVASNGKSDSIMRHLITGEIMGHNKRPRAVNWYVLKN